MAESRAHADASGSGSESEYELIDQDSLHRASSSSTPDRAASTSPKKTGSNSAKHDAPKMVDKAQDTAASVRLDALFAPPAPPIASSTALQERATATAAASQREEEPLLPVPKTPEGVLVHLATDIDSDDAPVPSAEKPASPATASSPPPPLALLLLAAANDSDAQAFLADVPDHASADADSVVRGAMAARDMGRIVARCASAAGSGDCPVAAAAVRGGHYADASADAAEGDAASPASTHAHTSPSVGGDGDNALARSAQMTSMASTTTTGCASDADVERDAPPYSPAPGAFHPRADAESATAPARHPPPPPPRVAVARMPSFASLASMGFVFSRDGEAWPVTPAAREPELHVLPGGFGFGDSALHVTPRASDVLADAGQAPARELGAAASPASPAPTRASTAAPHTPEIVSTAAAAGASGSVNASVGQVSSSPVAGKGQDEDADAFVRAGDGGEGADAFVHADNGDEDADEEEVFIPSPELTAGSVGGGLPPPLAPPFSFSDTLAARGVPAALMRRPAHLVELATPFPTGDTSARGAGDAADAIKQQQQQDMRGQRFDVPAWLHELVSDTDASESACSSPALLAAAADVHSGFGILEDEDECAGAAMWTGDGDGSDADDELDADSAFGYPAVQAHVQVQYLHHHAPLALVHGCSTHASAHADFGPLLEAWASDADADGATSAADGDSDAWVQHVTLPEDVDDEVNASLADVHGPTAARDVADGEDEDEHAALAWLIAAAERNEAGRADDDDDEQAGASAEIWGGAHYAEAAVSQEEPLVAAAAVGGLGGGEYEFADLEASEAKADADAAAYGSAAVPEQQHANVSSEAGHVSADEFDAAEHVRSPITAALSAPVAEAKAQRPAEPKREPVSPAAPAAAAPAPAWYTFLVGLFAIFAVSGALTFVVLFGVALLSSRASPELCDQVTMLVPAAVGRRLACTGSPPAAVAASPAKEAVEDVHVPVGEVPTPDAASAHACSAADVLQPLDERAELRELKHEFAEARKQLERIADDVAHLRRRKAAKDNPWARHRAEVAEAPAPHAYVHVPPSKRRPRRMHGDRTRTVTLVKTVTVDDAEYHAAKPTCPAMRERAEAVDPSPRREAAHGGEADTQHDDSKPVPQPTPRDEAPRRSPKALLARGARTVKAEAARVARALHACADDWRACAEQTRAKAVTKARPGVAWIKGRLARFRGRVVG